MLRGDSAVDAVEAAVRVLEDCPLLNAGRGSVPNKAGVVEMDAMIMDGRDLALGAVACVQRVRNPVSLARRVMTGTRHVLLAGAGADHFADEIGFPRCSNDDLIVPGVRTPAQDTVGAVAVDGDGNVATATSTGGIPRKMPGRVGDSPIAGAGGYADNASAAVSATGDGEAFIKLVISKRVCDAIAACMTPQVACEEAMRAVAARLGAHGGLIAVTSDGRIGVTCDTTAMPYAHASADGEIIAGHQPPRP
jgi:beta-aspartyl-peptidase (threonine type)